MEVKSLPSEKHITTNRNVGLLWKAMFLMADIFQDANEFLESSRDSKKLMDINRSWSEECFKCTFVVVC